MYRKLVEFYSEKNDKIYKYFADKISLLSVELPNMTEVDERLSMSMAREIQLEADQSDGKRFTSSKLNTPVKYDPEAKKRERSKNAQISIEISKIRNPQNH